MMVGRFLLLLDRANLALSSCFSFKQDLQSYLHMKAELLVNDLYTVQTLFVEKRAKERVSLLLVTASEGEVSTRLFLRRALGCH